MSIGRITATALICLGMLVKNDGELLTNTYLSDSKNLRRLYPERAVIYDPPGEWSYTHHPSVAAFKGKLYAIFSNGRFGEDENGQRVMLSISENFTDWSVPVPLVSPGIGNNGVEMVSTPGGITVINNRLFVYYTLSEYDSERQRQTRPKLYAIVSDDGIIWSEPTYLKMGAYPCQRPIRLSNGRYLFSNNMRVCYTDDSTALSGWKVADMDKPEWPEPHSLCEGTLFQRSDGTVVCAFRSTGKNGDGHLYQSISDDYGLSWTAPVKTRFTDGDSKSCFVPLPDGRYFYVGTPDNRKDGDRYRWPLVAATSVDGVVFDRTWALSVDRYSQLYPGRWKGGDYGYPFALVDGRYVYVIVSRRKERLEIFRIELEEL